MSRVAVWVGRLVFAGLILAAWLNAVVSSAAEELKVDSAWVRLMPPVSDSSAGYVTLSNSSGVSMILVGASSDAAEKVEFHRVEQVDGLRSMKQVKSIELPPKGQFRFSPGADHIMLLGLKQPLKAETSIDIRFQFESGDVVSVPFQVRRQAIDNAGDSSGHHHH